MPRVLIPERIPCSQGCFELSTGGLTARHLTHRHTNWDTAFRFRTLLCTVSFLGFKQFALSVLPLSYVSTSFATTERYHTALLGTTSGSFRNRTNGKGSSGRLGSSVTQHDSTQRRRLLLHGLYGTRGKSRNCCCS